MKNKFNYLGLFLILLISSCSNEEFETTSESKDFDASSDGTTKEVNTNYSYVHDGYDSGYKDGSMYTTISKNGGDADFWLTDDSNHPGRFSVDCRSCDIVAGKGWRYGYSGRTINYAIDYSYGNYDMIGAYGWTYEPELVEYYVIERGPGIKAPDNNTYLEDSGKKYKMQVGYRENAASVLGYNANFKQFVSYRYEGSTDGHQYINMQKHFDHWGANGGIGGLWNHDYQAFGIEVFTASDGSKKSGGLKANVW